MALVQLRRHFGVSHEVQQGTQGASRIAPGNSNLHSCCEGELGIALVSLQVNRRHLGLCPENLCSSPVATGILVLHSRFTRGVRPHLEWKQRIPLSSPVATGIS